MAVFKDLNRNFLYERVTVLCLCDDPDIFSVKQFSGVEKICSC